MFTWAIYIKHCQTELMDGNWKAFNELRTAIPLSQVPPVTWFIKIFSNHQCSLLVKDPNIGVPTDRCEPLPIGACWAQWNPDHKDWVLTWGGARFWRNQGLCIKCSGKGRSRVNTQNPVGKWPGLRVGSIVVSTGSPRQWPSSQWAKESVAFARLFWPWLSLMPSNVHIWNLLSQKPQSVPAPAIQRACGQHLL